MLKTVSTQLALASDTLPEVLAKGNTTGGTDLAVSAGDDITFADNSKAIFGAGSDLSIHSDGATGQVVGNVNVTGAATISGNVTAVGAGTHNVRIGSTNALGAVLYLDGSSNGDFSGGDYATIEHLGGNLSLNAGYPNGDMIFTAHNGSGNQIVLTLDGPTGAATFSDNIIIGTSGKGIDFSATAGTGTSELLDDYEEGVWTPNLAVNGFSGAATVSASSGTYTKVGRVVTVSWSVTLSTAAYMSSYSQINNLPFAATVSGTCGSYATGSIGGNVIGSFGSISTSNLFLFQSISTSTSTSWDGSHTYIAT